MSDFFYRETEEINQDESSFPSNKITENNDDLNYLVVENDDMNSVSLILLPQVPKEKNRRPKRKRQPLDTSSSSFDISSVLPEAGEPEWDPAEVLYHTGKWPMEEERFANRLVLEFEAGVLEDCKDGCTLRSYLAKTLRCAPMRVSKKFAGKCIGSKAFARKEGDRKSFLEKISAGELNIAILQKRPTQKPERRSKLARPRSPSDLTDDENSSGSGGSNSVLDPNEPTSSSDGGDNDSESTQIKKSLMKRKSNTVKKKIINSQSQAIDVPVITDDFFHWSLPDSDNKAYNNPVHTTSEYGSSGFYLSNAADPVEEDKSHYYYNDVGYDEWQKGLSMFKETDWNPNGLLKSESNLNLMSLSF